MNVNLLKGTIIAKGFTIKQISEIIGIDETTFYRKMNGQSDFYCGEIKKICDILHLSDPTPIFFDELLA